MQALNIVLMWLAVYVGNIGLAKWHSVIISNAILAKAKKAILHGIWAAGYAVASFLPMIPHWNTAKWLCSLLGFSYALLHASVFPVWLNKFRKLPPYFLSTTSTSWFDRIQVWVGFKTSEVVNISAFIISTILAVLFICLYLLNL